MRRICLVLLLLSSCALAGDKKGFTLTRHPFLSVEARDLEAAVAAQPCTNFAWSAALEIVLRAQQVPLDQQYWAEKTSGLRCLDEPFSFDDMAAWIDGEYTVGADDRLHKVRLETRIVTGAPTLGDDLIADLKAGRPALLFWKQRSYVLYGLLYDEYVYPNGQRNFQLRELRLIDPLRARGAERRVTFHADVDDPNDINGVLRIHAISCPANVISCR